MDVFQHSFEVYGIKLFAVYQSELIISCDDLRLFVIVCGILLGEPQIQGCVDFAVTPPYARLLDLEFMSIVTNLKQGNTY